MNVLLIGYGSIGKRHYGVLSDFDKVKRIDIVTRQTLEGKKTFLSLEDVDSLDDYDYFLIASETNKHFEQLSYLESKVSNKTIFCEKPIFESKKDLNIEKNTVYVGYVLRFNPLLLKLKEELQNQKIFTVEVNCGSYLPLWRSDIDYRECYSAQKENGGGVLLDLSHEIDYLQWLFGSVDELKSYQLKISDLEINSDDLTSFVAMTNHNIFVSLTIDYISKISHRRVHINTQEYSYELDFITNKLTKKDKIGLEEVYSFTNLERNYMFNKMHEDILFKQKHVCTYEEGIEVMNTISMIQEQNNG